MSDLTEEAKLMLKETVSSPSRRVMCIQYHNRVVQFIANRKALISESNGRAIAVWESALEELVTQGLLDKVNEQTFQVPKKGYECAESLGL